MDLGRNTSNRLNFAFGLGPKHFEQTQLRQWTSADATGANSTSPSDSGLYFRGKFNFGHWPIHLGQLQPREATGFQHAPMQVGVPATMGADAKLGFSRAEHQSAAIALDICGGRGRGLPRMEGASSRGSDADRGNSSLRCPCVRICRDAPRGNPSQRRPRKVGFCVCRARITHVAAPETCKLGENERLKRNRVASWKRIGPWAPRYLAARH